MLILEKKISRVLKIILVVVIILIFWLILGKNLLSLNSKNEEEQEQKVNTYQQYIYKELYSIHIPVDATGVTYNLDVIDYGKEINEEILKQQIIQNNQNVEILDVEITSVFYNLNWDFLEEVTDICKGRIAFRTDAATYDGLVLFKSKNKLTYQEIDNSKFYGNQNLEFYLSNGQELRYFWNDKGIKIIDAYLNLTKYVVIKVNYKAITDILVELNEPVNGYVKSFNYYIKEN